jgi:taurine dioxygenase
VVSNTQAGPTQEAAMGITVAPLADAAFGATVRGLDPGAISESRKDAIWDAYKAAHGLLIFSFDRLLERDELHALTAVFGDNEFAPGVVNGIGKRALPGEEDQTIDEQLAAVRARGEDPYISYIGNLNPTTLARTENDPNFYGEWEWHTDMSYIDVPPTFSLLHARRIPAEGGDTGFCSQVMAARHLPDDLRRRIAGRRLKHDSTYSSNGTLRPGMAPPASPIEAEGSIHPILRIVPTTGEEALFLGRRTNAYVVGLPLAESEQLIDELWAHATQDAFCYRHKWREGEVVVWDNRMLLHKRFPIDESLDRFMWRTQTKGEAVVAAG